MNSTCQFSVLFCHHCHLRGESLSVSSRLVILILEYTTGVILELQMHVPMLFLVKLQLTIFLYNKCFIREDVLLIPILSSQVRRRTSTPCILLNRVVHFRV